MVNRSPQGFPHGLPTEKDQNRIPHQSYLMRNSHTKNPQTEICRPSCVPFFRL